MIKTLFIRNYRVFRELSLDKLARVNLFVGKNGSGKSCLLEALYVYFSGVDSSVLTRVVSTSEENRNGTSDGSNVQIVPPQNINDETVEKLWNNINATDLEEEVIRCLKLIDPNVREIAFEGKVPDEEGRKHRVPIARYTGSEERIPLKNLGTGMTRLFHISLSLLNARNGYLLIDEFENGLHWSIHPGLWKIIFILAQRLNVQVFATTHNRDCIRGFFEVWSDREDEGTFCRLDIPKPGEIRPVNYTCETLSDALETGVEVR